MHRVDEHLRIKEVSAELDVSYVTVINYIKRGHLRAFKVGGQWRIKPSELERFKREGNLLRKEENYGTK